MPLTQDLQPLPGLADGGGVEVHFHGRFREREVRGAEAHAHRVHLEERLAEFLQAPLEMAEVRGLVDHQALDLVEHGRVRGVAVEAIDAARRDDADRRLLRHHGADLHGARVRAQHLDGVVVALFARSLHVEGVVLLPGGMLGRDVELGEVEIVGLDVGALGDGEAHVAEDLGHLVPHLADGMDAAFLQRAEPHGQRDVGLLGGEARRELAALQIGLARLQCIADARLEPVDRLSERLALVGGQRAELRHQLGHASLLAQGGDAHALDGVEIAGGGDLGEERGFKDGEVGVVLPSTSFPRTRGNPATVSAGAADPCSGMPARATTRTAVSPCGSVAWIPALRGDDASTPLSAWRMPGRRAP